jgi:hypothetical protein
MNNMRMEDFQELEELFVDMECLLSISRETNDYTEEHYRTHCELLKQINEKYQIIKEGAIGKYCTECKDRTRPTRNTTLKTEEDKKRAYEAGNTDIVYCKECNRYLNKVNLKKHKMSATCRAKKNLKISTMICKKYYCELHLDFQALGDKLDHFCNTHTYTIRNGKNQDIQPELRWTCNDESSWYLDVPFPLLPINQEIKLAVNDPELYTRQVQQIKDFLKNNPELVSLSNSNNYGFVLSIKIIDKS